MGRKKNYNMPIKSAGFLAWAKKS